MQMEESPNLTPPATTEGVPGSSAGASLRREVRAWARDLLLALALAMVIIIFLYRPVKVEGTSMTPLLSDQERAHAGAFYLYWPVEEEGTSMTPLLSDQERIFINKFVYRFEPIERGDVVVFWYPLDRSKSFIKRVVALPIDELV